MKKVIAIFGVLAFTAGMAFGQEESTSNTLNLNQENNGNQSTVLQDGESNDINIDQVSYNDEIEVSQQGESNKATFYQGAAGYSHSSSWNSESDVNQDGERNEVVVRQIINTGSSRNRSIINQTGNDNYADQDLKNLATGVTDQFGNDNTAIQDLTSNYRRDNGIIDQDGNKNYAKQIQTVSGYTNPASANSHFSDISQTNDYNHAETMQNGSNTPNEAKITQISSQDGITEVEGNWAKIYQNGKDNDSEIIQNGLSNYVYNTQEGNENILFVEQIGESNLFMLEQKGNGNKVEDFTQNGDNNKFAGVTLTEVEEVGELSFNEDGFASQNGSSTLDADSYQTGNDNEIGLRQGEGDWARIQQNNDGNSALLWQDGGNNATIIQDGNNNVAKVQQFNSVSE